MAYDARVIEVMIASPGEVAAERQIVREVLAEWNAIHSRVRGVVLSPVSWETHSSPDLSGRAQQIINDRVLSGSDLVVGIIWSRVGSPTGQAASGTIEEIQHHHAAGKPVMLYFSNAAIPQGQIDPEQLTKVHELKAWAQQQGLTGSYDNPEDFRQVLRHQLQLTLRDNPYLSEQVGAGEPVEVQVTPTAPPPPAISDDARQLLIAAAANANGMITVRRFLNGADVRAGGQSFANGDNRRDLARWTAAAEEVHYLGLSRDLNGKREIFELTHDGYELAERLNAQPS